LFALFVGATLQMFDLEANLLLGVLMDALLSLLPNQLLQDVILHVLAFLDS
jgi:hypothetical protein